MAWRQRLPQLSPSGQAAGDSNAPDVCRTFQQRTLTTASGF
ncbi:hypothetical protein AVDCRST_MAG94-3121 [uncultured Leptolyngbya sp.]|uniref:Uncharacterized protein n=1 Tax=uncultured Leptolyngbya sp. TaxID=332963 RepID=A0A6J4MJA3_9CYAN|nr:hypothetical protein AVDCRST_MAG94-3121 [uncultured Leptolyngbya sp.]